jgi:hypothetical protein
MASKDLVVISSETLEDEYIGLTEDSESIRVSEKVLLLLSEI